MGIGIGMAGLHLRVRNVAFGRMLGVLYTGGNIMNGNMAACDKRYFGDISSLVFVVHSNTKPATRFTAVKQDVSLKYVLLQVLNTYVLPRLQSRCPHLCISPRATGRACKSRKLLLVSPR